MPGSLPLPFPDPAAADQSPADAVAEAAPEQVPVPPAPAADDAPTHRRSGLLFGPDAWDDTTTPPSPPQGDGSGGS